MRDCDDSAGTGRSAVTRRDILKGAGGSGLLAAAGPLLPREAAGQQRPAASSGSSGGAPEQVHLTWGADPSSEVVVSWASQAPAASPHVVVTGDAGRRVIRAAARPYTDGLNGGTTWTYHAAVGGLKPGTSYQYAVTTDNASGTHGGTAQAGFRTAPRGRAPFRFTSFGDLATPNTAWAKIFTKHNAPVASSAPGVYTRAGADALEDAIWSAKADTSTGYGIAVFDLDPGSVPGGQTSITVRYFHAVGADPVNPGSGAHGSPAATYTEFETFKLIRRRSS